MVHAAQGLRQPVLRKQETSLSAAARVMSTDHDHRLFCRVDDTHVLEKHQGNGVTVLKQRSQLVSLLKFRLNDVRGKGYLQKSEANVIDSEELLSRWCRFADAMMQPDPLS